MTSSTQAQLFEMLPFVDPIDRRPLHCVSIETRLTAEGNTFIANGSLITATGLQFPIVNGVPDFTEPSSSSQHSRSAKAGLSDQARTISQTFSEEWAATTDSQLSFIYTTQDLVRLHRDVWLQMDPTETTSVKNALLVGCGNGAEAWALAEIFPNALIYAVDVNANLLEVGEGMLRNPRIVPVRSELQSLPFELEFFDHVHCQGVLHHNRSTRDGFHRLARYVKPNGSMFVWVYANDDRHGVGGFRGALVRLYWGVSHALRPLISRLPRRPRALLIFLISLVLHPRAKKRALHKELWTFANTKHGIRDAFSPRFAHEHTTAEVVEWFEECGFDRLRPQRPLLYRKIFGRRLLGIGFLGWKSSVQSEE